ncbi:MAG: tetratricopeptide repeat protein [Alphaproteobacteria bacterium]
MSPGRRSGQRGQRQAPPPLAPKLEIEAAMAAALDQHRAGRLGAARQLYERILARNPRHAGALHGLGLIAHQAGRHDVAVSLISQAVAADGRVALYAYNLGEAYRALGRAEEAAARYRGALALEPDLADAHFALGNVLYEQGRLDEAVLSYRRAAELAPADAEAHNNLGNALMDRGEVEAAILSYERALAVRPRYAEAELNLGAALKRAGRIEDARAAVERALAIDPRLAEAHVNLGNLLAACRDTTAAMASYDRALSIKPDLAEAHYARANLVKEQGDFRSAAEGYVKAVTIRPGYAIAHNNLGSAFLEMRDLDQAVKAYREAIRIRPEYAAAWSNLASALNQRHEVEPAMRAGERALELDPGMAEAHYMMGICFEQLGRFEEAKEWQNQALALKPELGEAHLHLAMSEKVESPGEEIDRVERLLANGTLTRRQRLSACFALGKLYDDLGEYDKAFPRFREGNELKKAELNFSQENIRAQVDGVIKAFDGTFFGERAGIGSPSELPVFVLGMPRSGTTLTEQIIASHAQVHGGGELPLLPELAAKLHELLGTDVRFPDCATLIGRDNAPALAAHYLEPLRAHSADALRITDKLPVNFLRVGLIAALLPRARIVHTRRDPLDTCLSCYFQNFARGLHFSYDLASLGFYYREYERVMAHWRDVLPGRMFEVRYEDLVANQEERSRQIIAHCGLEWDPRCLAFHEHERAVRTSSFWQVRQRLYASSVGRWRHYERHLGPLKESLGLA